jgi:hypothetical protein
MAGEPGRSATWFGPRRWSGLCGTKVTHSLEITGPAAEEVGPQLGPAITEDFPEAMDALLARAAS